MNCGAPTRYSCLQTGGGAIPVAPLDGVAVGGRAPGEFGPVSARLQAEYWGLHEDPRYVEAVAYASA